MEPPIVCDGSEPPACCRVDGEMGMSLADPLISEERLAEIRARCEQASPGPWEWDEFDDVTLAPDEMLVHPDHPDRCALAELVEAEGERWVMTPIEVVMRGLLPEENDGEPTGHAWAVVIDRPDAELIAHARQDIPDLLAEMDRLREHNEYLAGLFYGITEYFGHLCEKHAAVPMEQRDLSRTVVPACQGCQEDDLRALVAGNPEATTMAERLRQATTRLLTLQIENYRLKHPND